MKSQTVQAAAPASSVPDEGPLAFRLRAAASRFPDKLALVSGEERLAYGALDDEAQRLAHKLISAGVAPGDRVALHMYNGIDQVIGYFGCLYAGAIAVPINTRLTAPEIAYVLEHSGASFYLGQPELLSEITPVRSDLGSIRAFVSDVRRFAAQMDSPPSTPLPQVDPDQPAVIIYTSGTTSRPKGVTHTHCSALRAIRGLDMTGSDVPVIVTPMGHAAGFVTMMRSVDAGATAVLSPRFDADRVLDDIAAHHGTWIVALPVMYQQLCTAQLARPREVGSLRHCMASGDNIAPTLKVTFAQAFGCPLYEAYASTEVGIVTVNWSQAPHLRGSCGTAVPGVEIALAVPTSSTLGSTGECTVKSPGMMVGYWEDPEATAAAIKDGWFHTGDLFRIDPEGQLWFEGRSKEIIIHGGSNISPQEVEAALYQHPGVREAGVVGVPDPVWGELVVAFISRTPGASVEAKELIAFVRKRLAAYKTPEHIIFLDVLPKGPSGKIQRRALREMLLFLRPEEPQLRSGAAA